MQRQTRSRKSRRLITLSSAAAMATVGTLSLTGSSVFADTITGTGWKGTSSTAWSNSGNWDNTPPKTDNTGDRNLFFGQGYANAGGAGNLTSNNDLTNWNGYRITFQDIGSDSSAANDKSFTLTGNAITLFDFSGNVPRIQNDSFVNQTVNFGVTVRSGAGNPSFNANNGNLLFGGAVTLNNNSASYRLDLGGGSGKTISFTGLITNNAGTSNPGLRIAVTGDEDVKILGGLTGGGDVLKQGSGTLTFGTTTANFGGGLTNVFLDKGSVVVDAGGSVGTTNGTNTGYIAIGSSSAGSAGTGTLTIAASGVTVANPINARHFSGIDTAKIIGGTFASGSSSFTGAVLLHDTVTLTAAGTSTVVFSGPITTGTSNSGTTSATSPYANLQTATGNVLFDPGPGIIKTGSGTVEFQGTSTYSGETYIKAGTVTFNNGTANSSTIRVGDDGNGSGPAATVNISSASAVGSVVNTRPGSSATRTISGTNATGTTASYTGNVFMDSSATITSTTAGANLAFSGTSLQMKGNTLTVNGAGNVSISNQLDNTGGTGNLLMAGSGTLTLSNTNNTYTGTTTVNSGMLVVNGTLASGGGTVTVNAGGTLKGTGTIARNVTGAGTVSPGNSIGTLHVNGEYSVTGTHDFEVSRTAGPAYSSDLIDQITNLTYGGTLKVSLGAGSDTIDNFAYGDNWNLFDHTVSQTGTFGNNSVFGTRGDGVNLPTLNPGLGWAFNYATGTLSVSSNPTTFTMAASTGAAAIIKGGSTTVTTTITNTGTGAQDKLNFTGLSASASGPGAGSVSGTSTSGSNLNNADDTPPNSSTNTGNLTFSSSNVGVATITPTATATNANLGSGVSPGSTSSANVTVYDHSNASLAGGSNVTSTTVTLSGGGSGVGVLRSAALPASQGFTIFNRDVTGLTVNMQLNGFSSGLTGPASTNLATFNGLSPSSGNSYAVSLNNTSGYGSFGGAISMAGNQLVDDSPLSGTGNNNNGGLTVHVNAMVGYATAASENHRDSFGGELTATVTASGDYDGLESKAKYQSGSSGAGVLGSVATILGGGNATGGTETVSMAWRTRNIGGQTGGEAEYPDGETPPFVATPTRLASDVVRLTGMARSGGGTDNGRRTETDAYALQMTYDGVNDEATAALAGNLFMVWLDPDHDHATDGTTADNGTTGDSDDRWVLATDGNFGVGSLFDDDPSAYTNVQSSWADFAALHGIDPTNIGDWVGAWGVDTTDYLDADGQTHEGTVWAVLNHNSDFSSGFSVVPEPGSLGTIAVIGAGLLGRRRRWRKAR